MGSVADEMTIASISLAATCLGAIFKPLGSLTGKAMALRLELVVRVHPWRQTKLKFASPSSTLRVRGKTDSGGEHCVSRTQRYLRGKIRLMRARSAWVATSSGSLNKDWLSWSS